MGLDYFNKLNARTWDEVAHLFGLDAEDLLGPLLDQLPFEILIDCVLLDEIACDHKQMIYENTHFTENISI